MVAKLYDLFSDFCQLFALFRKYPIYFDLNQAACFEKALSSCDVENAKIIKIETFFEGNCKTQDCARIDFWKREKILLIFAAHNNEALGF